MQVHFGLTFLQHLALLTTVSKSLLSCFFFLLPLWHFRLTLLWTHFILSVLVDWCV